MSEPQRGLAWLDGGETGTGRFVRVWVTERPGARARVEPIAEADKEPFLAHMRAGGTFHLTSEATPEDKQQFVEGLHEGFVEGGGLIGHLAQQQEPRETS